MADKEYKYSDLMTILGLLEVQVTFLTKQVKEEQDADKAKFLKTELTKMKSLRLKTKKQIDDY